MTLRKSRTRRTRIQTRVSLLALTALGAAATPLACADEFTSCEDTLTCEAVGGTAGEGGDGAGAAGAGGGDASNGGGVGAASGAPGSEGGAGGGAMAGLTVLQISPSDGTLDVERDEAVVIPRLKSIRRASAQRPSSSQAPMKQFQGHSRSMAHGSHSRRTSHTRYLRISRSRSPRLFEPLELTPCKASSRPSSSFEMANSVRRSRSWSRQTTGRFLRTIEATCWSPPSSTEMSTR